MLMVRADFQATPPFHLRFSTMLFGHRTLTLFSRMNYGKFYSQKQRQATKQIGLLGHYVPSYSFTYRSAYAFALQPKFYGARLPGIQEKKVFCSPLGSKFSGSRGFTFCTCLLVILTVGKYVTAAASPQLAVICHSMLTTERFMICLNNPSPLFNVSYMNGIAPRRASECLMSPHHHRRQQLLQQGHAWLRSVPARTGSGAEIYSGQSRFTLAHVAADCSRPLGFSQESPFLCLRAVS